MGVVKRHFERKLKLIQIKLNATGVTNSYILSTKGTHWPQKLISMIQGNVAIRPLLIDQ